MRSLRCESMWVDPVQLVSRSSQGPLLLLPERKHHTCSILYGKGDTSTFPQITIPVNIVSLLVNGYPFYFSDASNGVKRALSCLSHPLVQKSTLWCTCAHTGQQLTKDCTASMCLLGA